MNTKDPPEESLADEFFAPFEDEQLTATHWRMWEKFRRKRPGALKYFEQAALREIARGRKHFATDAIIALFRWNTGPDPQRELGEYKIGQNLAPLLSRWFVARHPECVDFFDFKRVGKERKQKVTSPFYCPYCPHCKELAS